MRKVIANDESGFWDVFEDGAWLARFESESMAIEFAAIPELIQACLLMRVSHPYNATVQNALDKAGVK